MQKKNIEIAVNQLIRYHEPKHEEEWDLKVQANLLELNSYSKVSYEDQDGAPIEVKWYQDRIKNIPIVEIKQEKYNLLFNPAKASLTHYLTPQGMWELEVETEKIEIQHTDQRLEISILYSIAINQESLADYEFRLQYPA